MSRYALSFAILALMLAAPRAVAQTTPGACAAPYSVGYRVSSVPGGPKLAIWYPTSDRERDYGYTPDLTGSVAANGAPATCARFPLVIFSHGFGGCGTQSIFFTEQLARAGYVVAAPDHKDATCSVDGTGAPYSAPQESFFDPDKWNDTTYADRKADLTAVINWMLQSADFGPQIDPARIGVSGHSLGGYTAMGMAGGWASWKDSRIRAVLLLSPYLQPFLSQKRLGGINIPLMYQGAQLDLAITPFIAGDSGGFAGASLPKFFMELNGGTHFEWTNLLCLGINRVSDCMTSKANARMIVSYGTTFFDRYLKQQSGAMTKLDSSGVAAYFRTVPLTTVIAASFSPDPGVSPSSIASAFGEAIAGSTIAATQTLPQTLAGVSVAIKDSSGNVRTAPVFFASPGQINFLVPSDVVSGSATASIMATSQTIATGAITVNRVAPSLFTADASGKGVAAAQYLRVSQDGGRYIDFVFDPNTLAPAPIDLGNSTDAVYLMLYGTGLRGSTQAASATIGGQAVAIAGPVAQSTYLGLDQVNLGPIPRSLAGKGAVDILLKVDGEMANTVTVSIR